MERRVVGMATRAGDVSLHARLRPIDNTRMVRAVTAWNCDDDEALELVLGEVADDPDGANGFVFALLSYADWLTRHTGPLLPGDPGPDRPEASA